MTFCVYFFLQLFSPLLQILMKRSSGSFAQSNNATDTLYDIHELVFFIVSRRFVQAVKRQISFLHLAQSFREVLSDSEIASKLLTELDHIDMKSIGVQAIYTTFDCTDDQAELHEQCKFHSSS